MKEDPSNSNIFLRFFKNISSKISELFSNFTDADLKSKLKHLKKYHNQMSFRERFLLKNVINFSKKSAEDVLIPRSEICAVDINIPIDKLFFIILDTYMTRIVVYEGDLDNMKGYIHIKDIISNLISDTKSIKISQIIREPIIVTSSTKLTNILIEMQTRSTHIAIVLDEYGCTDGIVTFEDIMEALVGNIEDEHDEKDNVEEFKFISKNSIISSGRTKISEIEDAIGVQLKQDGDNCDTIGGLIISRSGKLPKKGSIIDITENVKAKIIELSPKNIKTINLILHNKAS
jgi:magnesium and cobalt transporter